VDIHLTSVSFEIKLLLHVSECYRMFPHVSASSFRGNLSAGLREDPFWLLPAGFR
jgi:hypothetical protein